MGSWIGIIVYLLGIFFTLIGLYSAWTKKTGFIARENADELLNAGKYGNYVQKVGIVYIGIGGIMIFVNVFRFIGITCINAYNYFVVLIDPDI